MNVALVMTAVKLGATVANKVEVTQLLKNADGKIEGARVRDNLTGEEWEVKARVISSSDRTDDIPFIHLIRLSGCDQRHRSLLRCPLDDGRSIP
jgi:hypothetical protein